MTTLLTTIAAVAFFLLSSACLPGDVKLPEVRSSPSPEPCDMPPLPPALVVSRGADPAHCIPALVRVRGLDVNVQVNPQGQAVGVEDVLDLCLVVGPDGETIPKHRLSDSEKACILEDLRDWRFAGLGDCWPVVASLWLGGSGGAEATSSPAECGAVQRWVGADEAP